MIAVRTIRLAALVSTLMLAGCVSFGGEVPANLLTLTADMSAPAGSGHSGSRENAIAIHEPEVPAEVDVLRVPVRVDSVRIAYLKDATWVEKPARLFRRLLAETVRVRADRLVIDGDDPSLFAETHLRGALREFGYDASLSAVVLRFDAVRQTGDGQVEMRRFEAIEQGVAPEAGPVGFALNRVANDVAKQVADWTAGGSEVAASPAPAE
ncbi:MAG: ABC transporter [Erythrobacter sp.]|nr:ABC transporter [Erythrobacter sp.]